MNNLLVKNRVVIIDEPINENNANITIQSLISLSDSSIDDIYILLDSPGGSISACFAIFDTMK